MANRSKGFVSFDFLFAMVPVLLMVSHILIYSAFMQERAAEKLEQQVLFDKLVSISNYVVRVGAAESSGEGFPAKKISPNLVGDDFSALESGLKSRLALHSLSIGFEKTEGTCIYRIVVHAPTGEIRKLYFCGE